MGGYDKKKKEGGMEMELSLSIASFPLDAETAGEMERLIDGEPEQCRTLLQSELWQKQFAKGFAVLAYTDSGELVACAAAADLVGLHHYEWSAFVSPDYRRLGLATALADGVQHSLVQRGAESELAAFTEHSASDSWLEGLGYHCTFQELQFEAQPLSTYQLAETVEIIPYEEQYSRELVDLLRAAFDESVLPVLEHNLEDTERHVYLMRQEGELVATATLSSEDQALWVTALAVSPDTQRSGYGQAFLKWSRHLAHQKKLARVLVEVETENVAWPVYEKAGFTRLSTISYWQRPLQ
ncbi:GNAT family N-acetyltransferase [Planococcus sp. A6]|uniref:GNAT family N-acetyltransferase n=1 Tax=Planococcus sp. A6 TaxID=2992760 RepID=UPI00237A872B|nr:GNAT family N-acetyltransferase [Planococcus sp. A6]MDE0581807.1 GNAT family N-acetyltransferase [Planococcus sp. A6]